LKACQSHPSSQGGRCLRHKRKRRRPPRTS
jgi:hypothetical protein